MGKALAVDHGAHLARDALLKKIYQHSDLPALGHAVSRVVYRSSSDDEAVGQLAQLVLADVGLTQKILRVSNTVFYRAAAGVSVTTISHAIFLLGFDTVKTIALAMLLVEGLSGKKREALRGELSHALCASMIGRELARRSHYRDPEEAAVAALFNNMGRVLVAAHDQHLHERIQLAMADGLTAERASMKVLGCSFDMLGRGVLEDWRIPDRIVQALTRLPPGPLKPLRGRQEWLQTVANLAADAAAIVPILGADGSAEGCDALFARYGMALSISREEIDSMLALVSEETGVLMQHARARLGSPLQVRNEAARENVPFGISAEQAALIPTF